MDYAPELGYRMGGMEMPVNYVVEMFCDRVAASKIYQKERYTDASPWEYYARSADQDVYKRQDLTLVKTLQLRLGLFRKQGLIGRVVNNFSGSGNTVLAQIDSNHFT